MSKSKLSPEPTFADAQSWWRKMHRPVTFTGVPGHPLQATVLWNTGLLFCSNPQEWHDGRPKLGSAWGLAPGLSQEMEGYELDALQVEFSFGPGFHLPDRLDNQAGEVEQELLQGRMPVVISHLKHDGLEWTCTVFSRASTHPNLPLEEQDLLTEVQWTAHNPGRAERRALLSCHLTSPHVALGYKIRFEEEAEPYPRHLTWQAPLLLDNRLRARLAAEGDGEITFHRQLSGEAQATLGKLGLTQDTLQFRAQVPGGESVAFRLLVPFYATEPELLRAARRTPFARALRKTQRDWQRVLSTARIETPERIINDCFDAYLYHAMLATGRRVWFDGAILKCSPNHYEAIWSAHSALAAYSLDLRGQHDLSRQVLETFLANQGPIPELIRRQVFHGDALGESEGFSAHPGFLGNIEGFMAILWAFYHGWILWALGQHARLSNDWAWLESHVDKLLLACAWIEEQRKRTRLTTPSGEQVLSFGLLPASNAFDWGFGHMFWSDAHTYRGLREIGECLQRLGHPRAKRILAQAEDYRQDIISAVTRSRDASPPVPLDDGTTLPFVPMSVEMRDYFAPDWTYVACGPLNLAWAGVVPADHELISQTLAFLEAGRPLGAWDEAHQKYQGWDWPARTPADEDFLEATRPKEGRCFLWRHKLTYEPGWIPQAFVFQQRDDLPALLEHLYSLLSKGGQHVSLRTPVEQRDGVAWTQPGEANLMWLMRSLLVREEGDTLVLAGSCPRAWLAPGKSLGVAKLPTHFGPLTFQLASKGKEITGSFHFSFHTAPARIRLRLRHPEGLLPKTVTVNGKLAHAKSEWLELPPSARSLCAAY